MDSLLAACNWYEQNLQTADVWFELVRTSVHGSGGLSKENSLFLIRQANQANVSLDNHYPKFLVPLLRDVK